MRSLAAIGLVWAAFDWPMPWLDRVGLAAVSLALVALAIPGRPRMQRPTVFGPSQSAGATHWDFDKGMATALAADDDDDA